MAVEIIYFFKIIGRIFVVETWMTVSFKLIKNLIEKFNSGSFDAG